MALESRPKLKDEESEKQQKQDDMDEVSANSLRHEAIESESNSDLRIITVDDVPTEVTSKPMTLNVAANISNTGKIIATSRSKKKFSVK